MPASLHIVFVALLGVAGIANARSMTVNNNCPFTVWPVIATLLISGTVPDQPTGWEADSSSSTTFTLADDWAGRIRARRDCDFSSGSTDPSTCLTGGCTGGLVCASTADTGVPPANFAEFALGGATGTDFYDISAVDGFDLPMALTTSVSDSCNVPACTTDVNTICPPELSIFDSNGFVVGCNSACTANLDGNPSNSPNCCTGSFSTPDTCPTSGVEDYDLFKGACPGFFWYPFDDASALYSCAAAFVADYSVTFCP